jgi:predicted enzyme related to lactoylglutathione lyase
MTPRLYRVILPVSDIERATAFYAKVLQTPGARVSRGRHYFDCDGTILACFDPRADGDEFDATPNPDHVYFAVDDLEAIHARARAAGCDTIDEKIATQPWGERMFYAKDPFGNPIAFVDHRTVFTGKRP